MTLFTYADTTGSALVGTKLRRRKEGRVIGAGVTKEVTFETVDGPTNSG